ncbi:MAG: glycosyltransferase family 39 protein [Candidatus Bathyarchaeota archaeon]|nr:glycosyltransferase family 39 protein [Candidatus Bathyarchaeota archaeon]
MKAPAIIQGIPQSVKVAILIVVLAKLLVFGLGYAAYLSSPEQPQPSPLTVLTHQFARPLAPQDGPHYLDIAKNWYIGDPSLDASNFIVFFPLYPVLIRLITVDLSYMGLSASALIVSNVCSVIALIFLYKLTKLDFDDNVAVKAVLFLSIFPTAYFLSAPYTEGLFFVLAISSLYFARLSKWPLAGVLGFLAALTRISGLLMLPVLLVEYLHQKGWKPRKIGLNVLWTSLTAAGFLVYLNINNQIWGTPFKFMEIQREHWYNTMDPLTGLTRTWGWANNGVFPENLILGVAPLAFAVFGAAMLAFGCLRRFRPSYLVYMLLSWMLALATSMWISVPRYIMAMFPMFILLGTLTQRKTVNGAIVAVFVGVLSYFTYLFALGYFVF